MILLFNTLKCNGNRSSDIVKIRRKRTVMGNVENTLLRNGRNVGNNLVNSKKGSLYIRVEIALVQVKNPYEKYEQRKRIATFFDSTITFKLEFDGEPNVFYNAILDGDVDYNDDAGNTCSLTFLVPEGFAHATTLTSAKATTNEQGVLSMEIDYDGTVDTPLNLKFVNNDETGYLSAIGVNNGEQTFLTQLGYMDEADGEVRTKMATIFAKDGGTFTKWTDTTTFYENQNKKIVATMPTTTSFGGWLGGLPSNATNNGGSWYGTSKELVIPTPTSYCYLWGRAWFETGKMGQTGMWTLAFIDEDNKHICSMHIHKSDTTGNKAKVSFRADDGNGNTQNVKDIDFTPSYWIPPNPYGSQSRDTNSNMFDLRKEGEKVTFFWYGGYYSVTLPGIASKKVKRIQFFTGQYNGRTTSQLVSRMAIRDVLVIDLKSQYWQDIPNRFPKGSIVETRKENGMNRIYRDGIATLEDLITGSTFPMLKPGKNTIEFGYSDFTTTPPTITATYEKRWY